MDVYIFLGPSPQKVLFGKKSKFLKPKDPIEKFSSKSTVFQKIGFPTI